MLGARAVSDLHRATVTHQLLALAPDDVVTHKDLVRFAVAEGPPLFQKHCAACHGADMKGSTRAGAPDLTDRVWLYGQGDVFSIERTLLYGIRSPQKKSFNVTEMPAFGLRGQLTDADIRNVVQYVLKLSGPSLRRRGRRRRICWSTTAPPRGSDCHGADGRGNSDYGAPDLTANAWVFGGDSSSIYNSIYYGRHGVMPAWIGKLTLAQIRILGGLCV